MSKFSDVLHVLMYGILAGASALAAASVLAVLRSDRRRVNGLAFAIGFLVAQLVVLLVALAVGLESVPQTGSAHRKLEAVVELLVGLGLLAAAVRVRRPHPRPNPLKETPMARRRESAMQRLETLRPRAVLGTGGLLGVGGPKRLTLTILVAGAIAAGSFSTTGEASLVVIYVLIATALVWIPVLLTLLFGERATQWTATAQEWWKEHKTIGTFVPLVAFGAYFVIAGVVGLVKG